LNGEYDKDCHLKGRMMGQPYIRLGDNGGWSKLKGYEWKKMIIKEREA